MSFLGRPPRVASLVFEVGKFFTMNDEQLPCFPTLGKVGYHHSLAEKH